MDQAKSTNIAIWWQKLTAALLGCLLIMQILAPLPAYAQSGGGVPGLRNCNFSAGQSKTGGSSAVGTCLKDIFNFIFVIALFAIAIRVATLALQNYNPFNNGSADKSAISLVWDVTLGLILIGGPAIILNTINPASLNINILNVGKLGNGGGLAGTTAGTGGSSSNSSNSKNSLNFGTGVITDTNFNKSVDKVKSGNTIDTSSAAWLQSAGSVLVSSFGPVAVNAQDNQSGSSDITLEEAQNVIKQVLTLENRCKYWLIEKSDLDNCQVLANSDGFKKGLSRLTDSERKSLAPLTDSVLSYSGSLVTNRDIEVKPTLIPPTPARQAGCNYQFAQILIKNGSDGVWNVVYSKICNNDLQNSALWQNSNGQIVPKAGTVAAANSLFDGNQTIYILN